MDLPFARESPYFSFYVEKHRGQLRLADEHLGSVVSCASELISAMQAVGLASRNLATTLEKTPAMFQSSTVVEGLGGVLQELSSAQDVLAESLELSFAKPLVAFRKELAKVDDVRRTSERADADAASTAETLLHGDWAKVEKDLAKQRKLAQRRAGNSSSQNKAAAAAAAAQVQQSDFQPLPSAGSVGVGVVVGGVSFPQHAGGGVSSSSSMEDLMGGTAAALKQQGHQETLATVVEASVKVAAEKRRVAERRRFDLARFVSSLQRRKGLVLAEVSVAGLCSLRAFYAQASHAIGDVANAAHREQTSIARACDGAREPWDLRMLRLQRILNQREVDLNLTGAGGASGHAASSLGGGGGLEKSSDHDDVGGAAAPLPAGDSSIIRSGSGVLDDGAADQKTARELLSKAEAAHKVYSLFQGDLADLYDESYYQKDTGPVVLEGYLYAQILSSTGRRTNAGWQRRWFTLDADCLKVKRKAGWGGQLLKNVLARETSTADDDDDAFRGVGAVTDLDDDVVATLLLSSVRLCDKEERCAFEVHSAQGQPYRLQCHGDDDCKRWIKAIQDGVEKQLTSGLSQAAAQATTTTAGTTTRDADAGGGQGGHGKLLRAFSSGGENDGSSSPSSPALSSSSSRERRRHKSKGRGGPAEVSSNNESGGESTPRGSRRRQEDSSPSTDDAEQKAFDAEECTWRLASVEAENPRCADCADARPDWCVINLGIVVCLRCSGVHRSLGTHVSKVRSLRLDRLSPLELSVCNAVGNDAANGTFEREALVREKCFTKPTPHTDAGHLANFVRAKWRDRLFVEPSAESPQTDLRAAVASRDAPAILAAIANDADIDALGPDGLAPLHVAAKAKSPTVLQLLVLNGAKIDATDALGLTALDHFLLNKENGNNLAAAAKKTCPGAAHHGGAKTEGAAAAAPPPKKNTRTKKDANPDVIKRYESHLRRLLTPSF